MPIYDFRCESCGIVVERLILPGEKKEQRCPRCGSPMKRMFSGSVGLVFKGSGFYITDYKNKESNSKNKTNKPQDSHESEKSD